MEREKSSNIQRSEKKELLSKQVQRNVKVEPEKKQEYVGYFPGPGNISTGSTLLDLAISGGRVRGGGLPAGIFVEIFGPNGSGKTVLLSEIAGDIQRKGGNVIFHDPEARLDKQFAKQFGLELKEKDYHRPNTVTEVFKAVRAWTPDGAAREGTINGIMADSLAALSTNMEMEKEEGDKMGGRRAKEFSEELRKTCRILAQENYLMVCSNQIRDSMDAGMYGPKTEAPGGKAIAFYSSLRLKTQITKKLKKETSFHGKAVSRIIGVEIEVEVFKSSIWKPFRTAPLTIIFDYGIDDIRQNLQFLKTYSGKNVYTMGKETLGQSMEDAITKIEENAREGELREEVITLWNAIEFKFNSQRKPKRQ